MNYSLSIEVYSTNTDHVEFIIEPKWWNIDELLSSYPFERGYVNEFNEFHFTLSKNNLKEIHELQLKNLTTETDIDKLTKLKIEDLVASEIEFKKLRILIFEWQSEVDEDSA